MNCNRTSSTMASCDFVSIEIPENQEVEIPEKHEAEKPKATEKQEPKESNTQEPKIPSKPLTAEDLFVVDSPVMEELKEKQLANFWTLQDLELINDDYSIVPERFIQSLRIVMGFFIKMDQVINDEYLSDQTYEYASSTKRFHHIQMVVEDVHHQVYTEIIKRLGTEQVLSMQHLLTDALLFAAQPKAESQQQHYLYTLATLEGFHFSFVFSLFIMLRSNGFVAETCKANEFVLKDEYLHCAGWLNVIAEAKLADRKVAEQKLQSSLDIQNRVVDTLPLLDREKQVMKALILRFRNSFAHMHEEFTGIELSLVEEQLDIESYIESIVLPTRTRFMDNTAAGLEYTNSSINQDFSFLSC